MLTFHIITLGISVMFGFIMMFFMRSKFSTRSITCTSMFAFLSSELICRVIFYKYMNFRHMFLHGFLNFSSDKVIKTVLMVAVINVLVIIFAMLMKIIFSGRSALFSVKRYKIFPFKAIQYFVIISGGLFVVLAAADVMMPQFTYWGLDNFSVNNNMKVNVETNIYENAYVYPLIKMHDNYEKQPDEKIILVLGDSFVWGDGANNINVLWWRMLQKRIHDEGFGKCRIVAVGQRGASTQDELYWLEHTTMLDDIKPDMIIIGYVTNDAQYYENYGTYKPYYRRYEDHDITIPALLDPYRDRWVENKMLMLLYMLFPNIERKIENDLGAKEAAVTDYPIKMLETTRDGRVLEVEFYTGYDWQLKIVEGENLERYNRVAIEPLGKLMQERSIPCVLMTTPEKINYDHFHARYKDVMPLFVKAGIPVYDCLDDLVVKHSDDIRYSIGINPVNDHSSIPLNKYHADYAFNIIKENYPDILGPANTYSKNDALIVNDWMPYDALGLYNRSYDIQPGKLLNPSVKDNTITFTYSDEWENNQYLYLPMNAQTVKLCFENPVSAKNIIVRNSDGTPCNDFTLWEAHIGNEGFEEFNTQAIPFTGDGKYNVPNENITSLNLNRSSKVHGEKIYTLTFQQ